MDKNFKDIIKIPEELDDAVLKGFEKGRAEKKKDKSSKIFKKTAVAAGVMVVGVTLAGVVNTELVSALPLIGDVFEYFDNGTYKQNLGKYEELGKVINTTDEDDGVKVTLNKVIVDDNIFMASLYIESDKLMGYDELRSPQDFVNADFNIKINGKHPSSYGSNVTIVDERTAAIILEVNVDDINLGDEVDIKLGIDYINRGREKIASGNWEFKIKAEKGTDLSAYEVNESLNLKAGDVNIEKLVKSDLTNRLVFSGTTTNSIEFGMTYKEFIVRDNTGKILMVEQNSGSVMNDGKYNFSYDILDDLNNVEYIEVIKAEGGKTVDKYVNNFPRSLLKATSIDETITNRTNEMISRKPTEDELKDGYALETVDYNLDIDRNTAFESIGDLIGNEIAVNSTDKVIIKDIKLKDGYTEVVMKIDGNYDYRLLGSVVLFDEEMNDSCAFEGSVTTLTDIEEKIVTVKLTEIDDNKKYTIAIPVVTDLVVDENQKVIIELK